MVNIADPTQPRQVGTYNPDQVTVLSAAFLGDHLFVAVRQELPDTTDFEQHQLRVLDLTDPVRPREVGSPHRGVYDVAVAGTLVFLANKPEEDSEPPVFPLPLSKRVSLEVMEFADLVGPKRLGSVPLGWAAPWDWGGGYKLAVAGRHACVSVGYHVGSHGLVVIDVSNPAQPRTVGTHYGGFNGMAQFFGWS